MKKFGLLSKLVFAILLLALAAIPSGNVAANSTVCTSNADCPTGQLCCYPCGIDGCDRVCMTVSGRRCPPIA